MSSRLIHGKNGFVAAAKLGTTNDFFVAATKNWMQEVVRHGIVRQNST